MVFPSRMKRRSVRMDTEWYQRRELNARLKLEVFEISTSVLGLTHLHRGIADSDACYPGEMFSIVKLISSSPIFAKSMDEAACTFEAGPSKSRLISSMLKRLTMVRRCFSR